MLRTPSLRLSPRSCLAGREGLATGAQTATASAEAPTPIGSDGFEPLHPPQASGFAGGLEFGHSGSVNPKGCQRVAGGRRGFWGRRPPGTAPKIIEFRSAEPAPREPLPPMNSLQGAAGSQPAGLSMKTSSAQPHRRGQGGISFEPTHCRPPRYR